MNKLKIRLAAYLRSCVPALKRTGKDLWNDFIFLVGLGISVVPSIAAGVWTVLQDDSRLKYIFALPGGKIYMFLCMSLGLFTILWIGYWTLYEKITGKKSKYNFH
ncbi:hypothetical protein AGMMS49938_04880 [Fibrobacterales bacterium]|nr:hypothetical protein AGMMS49938_04880 [Fibrobacterales bacterium]